MFITDRKRLVLHELCVELSSRPMRRNPESVTVRRPRVLVSKMNERGKSALFLEYKHVPVRIISETSNRSEQSQLKGAALLFTFFILFRSD